VRLLAKRGDRQIRFDAPSESLPGGEIVIRVSRGLVDAAALKAGVSVRLINPTQRGEAAEELQLRSLHAKQFWLENDSWVMTMIGSSNCTAAGLGVGTVRNTEANLVYKVRSGSREARTLAGTWPSTSDESVDLNDPRIRWEPAFDEAKEGEGEVLPAAFEEALFKASPPKQLRLRLGRDLPPEWAVRTTEGTNLISGMRESAGAAGIHGLDWDSEQVPVVLTVSWRRQAGGPEFVAQWPVNVVDPSELPAPQALRDLTLEELVEILSATRPIHESITRILAKRLRKRATSDVELDPLKRVNTEEFLLRRTRRVALALDRLRQRLERPVLSPEALSWRLRGPIGPVGLAQALLREARLPGEAAFFLAELVLMLRRVRPDLAAIGGLGVGLIQTELATVVDEIKIKVAQELDGGTPSRMAHYVSDAMEASLE
jgi:hypothetical protein